MGRSNLQVRFSDGTILHGSYDNTSDRVHCPLLFETAQEARNRISSDDNLRWVAVENTHGEEAVAATDYGGGFWWHVEACKDLRGITHNPDPLDNNHDGLPDWWQEGGT